MQGGVQNIFATKYAFLAAFFIFYFIFCPVQTLASTVVSVSNTITTSTVWTVAGSPYLVRGFGQLRVSGVLTIEPGVIVKFDSPRIVGQGSGLFIQNGGSLIANGTAEQPIIFTSQFDDVGGETNTGSTAISLSPLRGDWFGIKFDGDRSVVSHAIIRYSGNISSSAYSLFGGVEVRGDSRANFSDINITNNRGTGLAILDSAVPTFVRATISDNSDQGIYSTAAASPVYISDSLVANNTNGPVSISADSNLVFLNTEFVNNGTAAISITNYTNHITHAARWQYVPGLVYLYAGSLGRLFVDPGASLTIDPGVQVKWYGTRGLYVQGEFFANGTVELPIVFTSYRDSTVGGNTTGSNTLGLPASGDWGGIYFDHATSTISHMELLYGGNFVQSAFGGASWSDRSVVHAANSNVSLGNITIRDGYNTAVTIDGTSSVSFNSSTIHQVPSGLLVATAFPFVFRNNYFSSTTNFAIRNNTTTRIDARHNWWGDDSGPSVVGRGDRIVGANGLDTTTTIQYDPWIGKRDPVILVPGILGSELKWGDTNYLRDPLSAVYGDVLWPNLFRMIITRSDEFMDSLGMNEDGSPISRSVIYNDVVREIETPFGGLNYFGHLISDLESYGFVEGKDLFVFPYDWRLDIRINSQSLSNFIDRYELTTTTGKIDIIAHSMGGLVTKQYMLDQGDDKIDTLIFLGTPHLGAPGSAKNLLFGDDLGISLKIPNTSSTVSLLDPQEIKRIGRNMVSIYELLPSRAYFTRVAPYFDDLTQPHTPDYNATMSFLGSQDLNIRHLATAQSFHSDALDNLRSDQSNIFSISGCRTPTIGTIIRRNHSLLEDEYLLAYTAGDGTVPIGSSDVFDLPNNHRFYLRNTNHSQMPSEDGTRQLLVDLIIHPTLEPSTNSSISHSRSDCTVHGKVVSVHSPVDIHVYDDLGNHVGLNASGTLDLGIIGVRYDNIANNKFVFLPDGEQYNVHLDATATGTFNLRVSDVVNDVIATTTYYNAVPIVPESQGSVVVGESPVLSIDEYDSGIETIVVPSATLDPMQAADLEKPQTSIIVVDSAGVDASSAWSRVPVMINLSAVDDNSGILRTEYSLDEGVTWQVYSQPFSISSENIRVLYRSIDQAGNIEEPKTQSILIDTTPPEARIYFDPVSRNIQISGFDTMTSTTLLRTSSTTLIIDGAGNTLELQNITTTTQTAFTTSSMLQITGLRYNDGEWQVIGKNAVQAFWQVDKKTNSLVYLNEVLAWKDHFYLASMYGPNTSGTQIWSKDSFENRSLLQTLPGIIVPIMNFFNFTFNYLY